MKKPFLIGVYILFFVLFSLSVTAIPVIELNASIPPNISSNITVSLFTNFSEPENGFVGNITLNEFSDGSIEKNFTFISNGDRTVYLNISKYSKIINAIVKVTGDRENVTNPVLETPSGSQGLWITPERCRVVPSPVSFDSVEISARVQFRGNYPGNTSAEQSGLIGRLRSGDSNENYQIIENKSCNMTEPSISFSWEKCEINYSGPHRIINKNIYACVISNDSSPSYGVITQYNVGEDGIVFFGDKISNLAETRYAIMPSFDAGFSSFPINVSIDMANNGIKEWINEGIFNKTETVSTFSSEINRYLENCEYDNSGYCLVPSVTYSDSAGIVRISDLNITYEENNTCQICITSNGACDTEWTISNATNSYSNNYLSGVCSTLWNTSTYDDGIYNVSVRIKDTAYNTGISSKKITLDRTAPTFSYYYPMDNGAFTVNNTNPENITNSSFGLTFRYKANDLSSITNCSLIFNDNINDTDNSVQKNEYNRFNLNISTTISGTEYYNWSIACTDVFGHEHMADTRKFTLIILSNFSGETTDLGSVNLSKIENLTFEDVSSGKIKFSDTIDLSGVSNINEHIKISHNRIEINSSALPALNKSATLDLYNLTYDNPRILKDGEVCPSSVCKVINYSNGKLVFNVSQFSVYSVEETPDEPAPPSNGGGGSSSGSSSGGGGGGAVPKPKSTGNVTEEETEKLSEQLTEENYKSTTGSSAPAITGAVVSDVGEPNYKVGIAVSILIIALGVFVYRKFHLKP